MSDWTRFAWVEMSSRKGERPPSLVRREYDIIILLLLRGRFFSSFFVSRGRRKVVVLKAPPGCVRYSRKTFGETMRRIEREDKLFIICFDERGDREGTSNKTKKIQKLVRFRVFIKREGVQM